MTLERVWAEESVAKLDVSQRVPEADSVPLVVLDRLSERTTAGVQRSSNIRRLGRKAICRNRRDVMKSLLG
jgi:hypothetical protein